MIQDNTSSSQPTASGLQNTGSSYLIISERISKEEFLAMAGKELMKRNISEAFIDQIDTHAVGLKYVCYCRIKGTVDCDWSCRTASDNVVEYNRRVITIHADAPINGSIKSMPFDAAFPLCGVNTEPWAKDADILSFDGGMPVYTEGMVDESCIYGHFGEDFADRLQQQVGEVVDFCLSDKVKAKAQTADRLYRYADIMPEEEAEKFADSTVEMHEWNITADNLNVTDIGEQILVPYYVLDINYDSNAYYISAPADGSKHIDVSVPMMVQRDIEDLLKSEQPFYNQKKLIYVLPLFFAVSTFTCFELQVAIMISIALCVLSALLYFKFKKADADRRNELIEERKAQSRRVAEKIKAKFR